MSKAQKFELATILATVALISGWGFGQLKARRPLAVASVERKAVDVKRDMYWKAAERASQVTVNALRDRLTQDPEPPSESTLRPAADPLAQLNESLTK